MTLEEAKKQVDHTLASMFYDSMKDVRAEGGDAHATYKQSIADTGALLMHMQGRLEILFGKDPEKLTQFLFEAGVVPLDQ